MKVERVVQLKNNFYDVYFSDQSKLKVHEESLVKYELLPNREIDEETLKEIKTSIEYDRAYIRAIQYISYKIRSKQEIIDNLSEFYSNDVIKKTTDRLEKEGYIDDEHYARSLNNTIFNTTDKGPKHLERKLFEKNIDENIIINEVEHFNEKDDNERNKRITQKELKKYKGSSNHFTMKLKKKLVRDGYTSENFELIPDDIHFDDTDYFEKEFEKYYNRLKRKHEGFQLKQKVTAALLRRGFNYDQINEKLGGIEYEF